MNKRVKVRVNDPCPCWSGKKFKHCCRGEVDWPDVLGSGINHVNFLSARGRNIMFAEAIFDALQLDNEKVPELNTFKRAFTAKAVQKIYLAIYELWPPETDLRAVLRKSSTSVAGLYIGDYETEYLERAVVRHSLYADRILLVDPFPHPHLIKPEYNPIESPDQYRAQTLKNVNRFLRFLPWVDAGLVEFIRTPDDFDLEIKSQAMKRAQEIRDDPLVATALNATVEDLKQRHYDDQAKQLLLLSSPDSYLRSVYRAVAADASGLSEDDFIAHIQRQRDQDPDFLEPLDVSSGQLHMMTSGGMLDMAKAAANIAGAYLFTDLKFRWEILKRDRPSLAAESKVWSPFAKAIHEAKLNFLDNVDLHIAMAMRAEGRLNGVRGVLRKAWQADLSDDDFDEKNVIYLAENLVQEIGDAEAEWADIKASLARLGTVEISAGMLGAGPLIASGNAIWLAGGAVLAAAGHTLTTHLRKRGFEKRYPASFFMDLSADDQC